MEDTVFAEAGLELQINRLSFSWDTASIINYYNNR